jgi:hypothetical protein
MIVSAATTSQRARRCCWPITSPPSCAATSPIGMAPSLTVTGCLDGDLRIDGCGLAFDGASHFEGVRVKVTRRDHRGMAARSGRAAPLRHARPARRAPA